jgi:hypothetical protein
MYNSWTREVKFAEFYLSKAAKMDKKRRIVYSNVIFLLLCQGVPHIVLQIGL